MSSEFDLEDRSKTKIVEAANAIKMEWDTPANDGKFLLLVEDRDDRKCYFKLFNHDMVEIQTTNGCNSMKHLFSAIQSTGVPVFAIQDSDFARICGKSPTDPNYFITDCHDHEMMCLKNEDIMRAVFLGQAVDYDTTLIEDIFEDLKMLSYLKWYSFYLQIKINFKGYKVRGKSRNDLRSFEAFYREVIPMSPKCTSSITENDIVAFVSSQTEYSRYEIVNGHDFLDLLAKYLGERSANPDLRTNDLRAIMYARFTHDVFIHTQLYQDICNWAGANAANLFAA